MTSKELAQSLAAITGEPFPRVYGRIMDRVRRKTLRAHIEKRPVGHEYGKTHLLRKVCIIDEDDAQRMIAHARIDRGERER